MSMKERGKTPAKGAKPRIDWKALEIVHPDAAGIDIGGSEHWVAISPERDEQPVRCFDCFTADLEQMADWLIERGVRSVAMQSTGVYWIPVLEILQERGLEVYLVNARHTKNLPGRKSDIAECQWLLKLHTFGLLNNSFQPSDQIRGDAHLVATPGRIGGASQQHDSADAKGLDGNEYPTLQCFERSQRSQRHGDCAGDPEWRARPPGLGGMGGPAGEGVAESDCEESERQLA